MFWIFVLSFVAFMTIVIMIYLSPGDEAPKKAKEKSKPKEKAKEAKPRAALIDDPVKPIADQKDWKTIAERWEKNNAQLNQEIEKLNNEERRHLKNADALKATHKELLEKLELEKSWREKEQVVIEKFKNHEKDFKDQIFRTEADLEKEHSNRMRIERDLQELKIKYDAILEEKRQLGVKAASQETTITGLDKKVKELTQENGKLKEKREDVQWVAKTAFDELQQKYTQAVKELEKLKAS